MNQNHYDVFYTANKGALVNMLMRALEEISNLNQENDTINEMICNHIEASVELREELSQARTASIYYKTCLIELQEANEIDVIALADENNTLKGE